jgi:hypothetical protein
MLACHACGKELDPGLNAAVGRRDECPHCRSPLHACRNCAAFDEAMRHGCCEPNAEPPRDKDAANFCDFFALKRGPMAERGEDPSAKAKAALDALFSGKPASGAPAPSPEPQDPAARARAALDALFKK